jgi:hypothetical protein
MSEDINQSPEPSELSEQPQELPAAEPELVEQPQDLPAAAPEPIEQVDQTIEEAQLSEQPQEQPSEELEYPPNPEQYTPVQTSDVDPYGVPSTSYGDPQPEYQVPPESYRIPEIPSMPPYGYAYIQPPLPLGQAIRELPAQYLRVLTRPGARTFAAEQTKAEWGIIWVQILLLALFNFLSRFGGVLFNITLNRTLLSAMAQSDASNPISGFSLLSSGVSELFFGIFAMIFAVIGLLFNTGVQYLLAKAFHGVGEYKQQIYTYLLIQVPIAFVGAVINFVLGTLSLVAGPIAIIPELILGPASFALGIYAIVLNVFSIMAVHRLSGGKSTAVVLILYGIEVLLVITLFVILFLILFAAFSTRTVY